MTKLPYMQFYPSDWLSDPALRSCSIAAKGLWIELLCLMWNSPERGVLRTVSGHKMDPKRISKSVGLRTFQCQKLITELHENGVLSLTEDGAICSRRMLRDEHIRQVRTNAANVRHGKICTSKIDAKSMQNPEVLQKSDVIYQKSELIPPVSPLPEPVAERQDALFQIDQKLIAWWNSLPGVKHTSRRALTPAQRRVVEGWVVNGFDWETIRAKFPLPVTAGRDGTDGAWLPSLSWFLEPGTAESVLDGKYDFTLADKAKPSGRKPEPGQIHDPSKPAEVGIVHW